jgi:uncharacterized RDD family membrane protein YckC
MKTTENTAPVMGSADLYGSVPLRFGSFGERIAALLLDTIILLVPHYLINLYTGPLTSFLMILVLDWLYYSVQESGIHQATIGKRIMQMKVMTLEGSGVSFMQASKRFFGRLLSGLILFIGYIMMIWDDDSQTLHDKIADTIVVKS